MYNPLNVNKINKIEKVKLIFVKILKLGLIRELFKKRNL